jgi:hypothetical protein
MQLYAVPPRWLTTPPNQSHALIPRALATLKLAHAPPNHTTHALMPHTHLSTYLLTCAPPYHTTPTYVTRTHARHTHPRHTHFKVLCWTPRRHAC